MDVPTLKTLINVYAHNKVTKVREDKSILENAFNKTLDRLGADIEFSPMRNLVAELKQRIEDRQAEWLVPGEVAQIGACLRVIWDGVLFDQYPKSTTDLRADVVKELFLESFKGKWSAAQIAHVEFVADILKSWNGFFVSYTNRSPRSTNDKYKAVIETFVEPTVRSTRNWDTDNLLADAIVSLLRRENLVHGFYDKINIQVSDNLDLKIGPAAGGSFMFVQLVQPETFYAPRPPPPPPPPNWCFEEYKIFQVFGERVLKDRSAYRDVFRKRFAPILADDKRPALLPFDYRAWMMRAFTEQRFEKLPVALDGFTDVVHKLALEIVDLHLQIIDCVPA
jgi:hypothetical protein